ncbi:hypothetical protein [Streptomyces sp. MB09-02B]|uniref:hypothetical protein n=1 Tax=Streptomyces sp. MB09-02B TaxID=3028667 RepID=UPI0029BCC5F4|nr:hypothetical protein [Streptomyces sp. MB09-02B]MDX3639984.1 hypothetical protein [Streptomyces sp. MB09-02B]
MAFRSAVRWSGTERDRSGRPCRRCPRSHGVANAFYLYLRDPDGHRVEIGTFDYCTGDPITRPTAGHAGLDLDGHPQPVSDALLVESAVQVGADGLG